MQSCGALMRQRRGFSLTLVAAQVRELKLSRHGLKRVPDEAFLPDSKLLTLTRLEQTEAGWQVEADGPDQVACPGCQTASRSRHSRYWRTLKDLSAHGSAVTLRIHVSRWHCRNCQSVRKEILLYADSDSRGCPQPPDEPSRSCHFGGRTRSRRKRGGAIDEPLGNAGQR
jgi:hypothetical protein